MKKSLLVMMIFMIVGMMTPVKEVQSEDTFRTIPDEAIRLRILANSDGDEDQFIKRAVRDEVNAYISELVQHIENIEEAREMIRKRLPEIRKIVEETLTEQEVSDSFTVDYRSDVTFPLKMYDNYVYPAGEYEAVLITIGEGKGANWWCVLFPPLCFLDFSNGATIEEELDEEESEEQPVEEEEEISDDIQDDISDEEEDVDEEEEIEVTFFLFEWLGLS